MKYLTVQPALSQLVIVDMQVKLAAAMPAEAFQLVLKNCGVLAQAAQKLNVAITLTEQYPQGLGATLPALSGVLANIKPILKTAFSANSEPKFKQQFQRDKPMVVLTGMEAHICVLQTALALQQAGKQVFVVEDAIISRNPDHKANAIARLREAGCTVTNTESVLFEWLGNANHEAFKALSALIQ